MREPPAHRISREIVLREFFKLSSRDQLLAFEAIRGYLGEAPGVASKVDREIQQRADALVAMADAVAELGLTDPRELTTAAFNEACKSAGSSWRSGQIIRAWASWRQAVAALAGERVREGPAQRQARKRATGQRRSHEGQIRGLAEWLTLTPASTRPADYEAWRSAQNEAGRQPPLVSTLNISMRFPLPWDDLLTVARDETSLADALKAHADRLAAEAEFVNRKELAALLETTPVSMPELLAGPGAPQPAARIGRISLWDKNDALVWKVTGESPHRMPLWRQPEILTSQQLAHRLGFASQDVINSMLHFSTHRTRLPLPAGRSGPARWWWSSEVEEWVRSHPEALIKPRRSR